MQQLDLLIRRVRIHDDAPPVDIGIQGGRICYLEEKINHPHRQLIDAEERVAIPGLLEPHIHLDKALLERRMPNRSGTLQEAIRITGILKKNQVREDVLERSRQVLDMALRQGTLWLRCHPDVDLIQGLIGVETLLELRAEYHDLLDLQIVAFPQEGILKAPGTVELLEEALRIGGDYVGACPYNERDWNDTKAHIDTVFSLAQRFDKPIDMHADFADDVSDRRFTMAAYIAEKTIATGYQGRVSLGHMTSLAALVPAEAARVIDLLKRANIHIVALPATDLYLGGRSEPDNPRRSLAPVRALRAAGVNVTYSSNNIQNAFTPFGAADPLQMGLFLAHIAQMGSPEDQAEVLRMGTYGAADAMGISAQYGIEAGKQADLVILDTRRVADALLESPSRSWVIKRGRIAVTTQHTCKIHR
jgi:cytosine/creatinine deaminase